MCTYLNKDALMLRYVCKIVSCEKKKSSLLSIPCCLTSDDDLFGVESCITGIILIWRGWIDLNPNH